MFDRASHEDDVEERRKGGGWVDCQSSSRLRERQERTCSVCSGEPATSTLPFIRFPHPSLCLAVFVRQAHPSTALISEHASLVRPTPRRAHRANPPANQRPPKTDPIPRFLRESASRARPGKSLVASCDCQSAGEIKRCQIAHGFIFGTSVGGCGQGTPVRATSFEIEGIARGESRYRVLM